MGSGRPGLNLAEEAVIDKLRRELGNKQTIQLLEAAAGTRVYVSRSAILADRFGEAIAEYLCEHWEGNNFKVPLGRQFRAAYYNSMGLSCGTIARLIGCTEGGVDRMLSQPFQLELPAEINGAIPEKGAK